MELFNDDGVSFSHREIKAKRKAILQKKITESDTSDEEEGREKEKEKLKEDEDDEEEEEEEEEEERVKIDDYPEVYWAVASILYTKDEVEFLNGLKLMEVGWIFVLIFWIFETYFYVF